MWAMTLLAFVIGYPVFMLIAYAAFRLLFPSSAEISRAQQAEIRLLLQRAQRTKRSVAPRAARKPAVEHAYALRELKLESR